MTLSLSTAPVYLTFKTWIALADWAQVQASTDGVNFVPLLAEYPRYTATGATEWSTSENAWVDGMVHLSDFAGEPTVYVRFALRSDASTTSAGVYLDDVQIEELH